MIASLIGCGPSPVHQDQACAPSHRSDTAFDGASDGNRNNKLWPCNYNAPIEAGRIDDDRLPELSGLVASASYPGWFWGHNDSGQSVARLYLIDDKAAVRGALTLPAVAPIDWE
ncbi:MAG: hypothetical protein CMH53_03655, partial [Myxococcales bacterium]|nr:hypothetical protein [Myxococcales bacterium]